MSRFAPPQPDLFARPAAQPDLFAARAAPPPAKPPVDPIVELKNMLSELSGLTQMPWPTISAAMQEEYRVLRLGKDGGPEGAALASAVQDQFERLLALTD